MVKGACKYSNPCNEVKKTAKITVNNAPKIEL